ncbi:T9SS type B sorting domain-containing protein [Taibaiella koreensis]|uniref:T9SS type B sorting domain-containing protein n=1 Tax=Taibaiella koreensis TaxID=1268548 RepID=UPI000E59F0B8|nr:gliding motility-associated C-terminal domain-containing protein [Taibaiella koreensis]
MKPLLFLFICIVICTPALLAQGENNIWCFGGRRSLDFNGASPVAGTSKVFVFEGSASVCNSSGGLLFYMGADTVWDRNHNYMPNGTNISGNQNLGSSYKGVGIIRFPFDFFKYFLITTDAIEQSSYNAYYSVIDMSLNGGLGDVVPGQKNILLDTNVVEGINLMPIPNCGGHWIVLHRRGNKDIVAYRADANGIAASPVVSQGAIAAPPGTSDNYAMNTNTSGNGIAAASGAAIELASFNNITGQFFNFHTLDIPMLYPAFSPDDSKLFISDQTGLYQADLSFMPNTSAVAGSLVQIDTGRYFRSRLGPDQKLYTTRWDAISGGLGTAIARLNTPNASGAAVTLERNFLPGMISLPFVELGNPAAVAAPVYGQYIFTDTVICRDSAVTLYGDPDYQTFMWSTGSTQPQETFTQPGVYWLAGQKNCTGYMDSIRIRFQLLEQPLLGPDTSICPGDTLILSPDVAGPLYHWQDGSFSPSYKVSGAGLYTVTADSARCQYHDSIQISLLTTVTAILQPDTTICAGAALTLRATASPPGSMRWSNGESGNTATVTQQGTYTVTATNVCGVFSDTVEVTTEDCDCQAFVPNAFSPNGDGNNDGLKIYLHCLNMTEYDFSLYNRYGQRVFHSNQPEQEWNGQMNGGKPIQAPIFIISNTKAAKVGRL